MSPLSRRLGAASGLALAALLAGLAPASEPFRLDARYLPMSDGVRLAADVYLPRDLPAGARVPAILHQTRYYRALDVRWPASLLFPGLYTARVRRFTARGYAYVLVDDRGSGASFGTRAGPWSRRELDDGAELLRWITRQSWSDGRVGAVGWSYDGSSAEYLVARRAPALRAVAPQYAPFDGYRDVAFPGGVHLHTLTAFFEGITRSMDANRLGAFLGWPARAALRGVRTVDGADGDALLRAAVREHTGNERLHTLALRTTFADDDAGSDDYGRGPAELADSLRLARVPVYSWSGWFDGPIARGAVARFRTVPAPGSRLLLGPWHHTGHQNMSPYATGDRDFDEDGELLRFFDRHVRGVATALDSTPAVRYFTIGSEQWHTSATWPPAESHVMSMTLGEAHTLSADASGGGLDTLSLPDAESGHETRWDAMILGNSGRAVIGPRPPSFDALPHYTTPPLSIRRELTGAPALTLSLTSRQSDGQLFVYLDDVGPDGVAYPVTEGMLRLLHRRRTVDVDGDGIPDPSFRRADGAPLAVGEPVEVRVDLLPISYELPAGHRLRLTLAGSDRQHFTPVTSEPLTIVLDRARARLDLPVIDR